MLEGGFILLHRSILRWEWYGDLNTARLFIHLLLTVNYEPQRLPCGEHWQKAREQNRHCHRAGR